MLIAVAVFVGAMAAYLIKSASKSEPSNESALAGALAECLTKSTSKSDSSSEPCIEQKKYMTRSEAEKIRYLLSIYDPNYIGPPLDNPFIEDEQAN